MKPMGLVILAVAIIGFGGLMYWNFQQDTATAQACPGHWHSGYAIFINGTKLDYSNMQASYANPPSGHDHHIHANDGIYHFHPSRIRCTPVEDMVKRLGVEVGGEAVKVTLHPGMDGHYAFGNNMKVRTFVEKVQGSWEEVSWSSIRGQQLPNGARFLFTFGDLTAEQIEAQKAMVPVLGPNYQPSDV